MTSRCTIALVSNALQDLANALKSIFSLTQNILLEFAVALGILVCVCVSVCVCARACGMCLRDAVCACLYSVCVRVCARIYL